MYEKRASAKKRGTIKRKEARDALRTSKKVYRKKSASKPKTWKKGGHEWSKVLGHFGRSW
jgi:hypothetical protein